jgi:hypothetical protein
MPVHFDTISSPTERSEQALIPSLVSPRQNMPKDTIPHLVSKELDGAVKHRSPIPEPYVMPQMLPASIVKGIEAPSRVSSGTAKSSTLNIKHHYTF